MSRAPRRWLLTLLRLGVLALFVTFVVGLSPHLVHHLFEHEGDADCPLAAGAERQQVTADSGIVPGFVLATTGSVAVATAERAVPAVRHARPVRAPPSPA